MLVLGLVFSISLSQITLGLLAVWLVLARRAGVVPRLRLPLALPLTIFVAWTVVAALASARPMDGLATCKNLINLAGLWIVASTLDGRGVGAAFSHRARAGAGGGGGAGHRAGRRVLCDDAGACPSAGSSRSSSGTASARTDSSAST